MKNLYTLALVLLAFAPVFVSCDDESATVTPPTPEQVLTRTWKVELVEVKEEGVVIPSVEYNDLTIRFAADGQYFVSYETAAFPTTQGTWSWENPAVKRNLVLDAGTDLEVVLKVESLEADRLAFRLVREGGIVSSGRALVIPDLEFYFVLKAI